MVARSPLHRFDTVQHISALLSSILTAAHAQGGSIAHSLSDEADGLLAKNCDQLPPDIVKRIQPGARPQGEPYEIIDGWMIWRRLVGQNRTLSPMVLTLVFRAQAPAGLAALEALLPLIDNALGSWSEMNVAQAGLKGLVVALDGLDLGILLLDRTAAVSFANRAGADILGAGDHLRWFGDRFSATHIQDALALQVALQHAIADNDLGAGSRHAPVLSLRSSSGRSKLIASIVPAYTQVSATDDTAAVVYLLDPSIDVTKQLQPVCRLFRLSAVEGRLACMLVAGATLRKAAGSMQIKELTARGYLKQIFLKTDTNRQADLVRLMLASVLRMQREIDPVFLA